MKKDKIHKTYITFGFDHVHMINEIIFDKDCVAVIETQNAAQGREKAFELFGKQFCFEYPENYFNFDTVALYYPRGLIKIPKIPKAEEKNDRINL